MSDAEAFLKSFHDERPGLTAVAFGALPVTFRGKEYASSYEALAAAASIRPEARVLDVGCGDGYLLSLLSRDKSVRLSGVDLSSGELRGARTRLGPAATLSLSRAQALPFPPAAFDHVFSHLALMLMDDAEQVLREVHRVLKPGGTFAVVVGAQPPPSPAFTPFAQVSSRFPRRAELSQVRFGDPRVRTAAGIQELLAPLFRNVSIDDLRITRRMTPAELWEWFLAMYDLYFLEEVDRASFEQEYLSALSPVCGPDGKVAYDVALRLSCATAA